MKKNVLFLAAMVFASFSAFAQVSFSDDFESYNVGDYTGVVSSDWTTWSGTTGGAEDAIVVDNNAASGEKSIYFSSNSANGGPQDVVLPFGAKYTTGQFNFATKIYLDEASTGAYFNFQGEVAIGVEWTMQMYFDDNGTVRVEGSTAGTTLLSAAYSKGEWIDVAFDVNLTTNTWNVSINGECIGAFENINNSIASLDIYPAGIGQAFWIDDVSYSYEPMATVPTLDLGMGVVNLRPNALTGTTKTISGSVKNNGTDMITSFDLTLSDGMTDITQSFSGLMLAMGDSYPFSLDEAYTFLEGATTVSVTISNINGMGDDENLCNNSSGFLVTGVTPAPGKGVYVEEGTGTWCQWCPRGAVFMDLLTSEYPDHFLGVAVHNGDPMAAVAPNHDAGIGSFPGVTGYPNSILARDVVVDPSGLELPFLDNVVIAPTALLENGAQFDASTNELQISLTATFNEDVSGDTRLNIVVLEDGVTGTSSGYAQQNAYGNNANGPMGGYENLPSVVPASQMVYDHVSRGILGGFDGESGLIPEDIAAGETHIINYSIEISPDWDFSKLKIIGFYLNEDGTADNATQTTIAEAIANGFQFVDNTNDLVANSAIKAFPNPFGDELNIGINLEETADVTANLYSATGALLRSQAFGAMNGENTVSIATYDLPNGIYQLNVVVGSQVIVKKVVLAR